MSSAANKKLVILYEPQHTLQLETLLKNNPETIDVLAIDAEVEYLLEAQGIPFLSGRTFRDSGQVERVVFADTYAQGLKSDLWKFLEYRDISLGELFVFPLQDFLSRALYYVELFKRVAEAGDYAEWVLFEPQGGPPPSGGPLAGHLYNIVLRAAVLVAQSRNIPLRPISTAKGAEARTYRLRFALTRAAFSAGVAVLNFVLGVLHRPRAARLVVSDYWKNMAAWVEKFPESEIVLLDRSEFAHIPFKMIWKHRISFVSLRQFLSRADRRRAAAHDCSCAKEWNALRVQMEPILFRGTDLRPLLLDAYDTLVVSATAPVRAQIDGAFALTKKARPTAVVLRTSVGGQTHFGVLAMVAKVLGVPAVESQHGLEYLGPGSVSRDHAAEYLAIYGSMTRSELEAIGYNPKRLVEVGSPRFDLYLPVGVEDKQAVLCIGPDLYLTTGFDSYDCADYFEAFFAALPPGRSAIAKLRGGQRESFFVAALERLHGKHEYKIEKERPLLEVLAQARVVVSCYSTSILESMQRSVPVVVLPVAPMETAITHAHFDAYVPTGAVRIAASTEELRSALAALEDRGAYETQRRAALDFLNKNFLFDGRASERFTAFLRSIARG